MNLDDNQNRNDPQKIVPQDSELTLYSDDSGELSLETRRVLVQLLMGPSLEGRRHPHLWPILIREEAAIRSRLSELFLQLVIDREIQVAFTRQADTGDLKVPLLLRRTRLIFLDSVLLLYLRKRLTQADTHNKRAVVSKEEIMEFMRVYDHADNSDRAMFDKHLNASIGRMKKHSVLREIRSSDGRFEISPTLKILFSVEEIQELTQIYHNMRLDRTSSSDGELLADKSVKGQQ